MMHEHGAVGRAGCEDRRGVQTELLFELGEDGLDEAHV